MRLNTRTRSWAARLWSSASPRLRATVEGLLIAAQAEPSRRRVLWAVAAVIMVAGPVVFNLSRSSGYRASVEIFPVEVPPFSAPRDPAYYRRMLGDPVLRQNTAGALGQRSVEWEEVEVAPSERRRTLVLSASDKTTKRARELIDVLRSQIAAATARDLERLAVEILLRLRARLRSEDLPPVRRALFESDLQAVQRLTQSPPERVVLAASRVEEPGGWADEIADALPGSLPARASPVWAGLAGLVLIATLWAVSLSRFPPRRQA